MSYQGNNALDLSTRAMFAEGAANLEVSDDLFSDAVDEFDGSIEQVDAHEVAAAPTFFSRHVRGILRELPVGGGRIGGLMVTTSGPETMARTVAIGDVLQIEVVEAHILKSARALTSGRAVLSALLGSENELAFVHRSSKSSSSVIEQIVRELGRLNDGWAWSEAKAPSESVLRDMQTAAIALPHNMRRPEIEVDPDDGAVVLRWVLAATNRTFSLTFLGNGSVTGFLSSDDDPQPAWASRVNDAGRLVTRVSEDRIYQVISE
jgi:hypothetical protein